MFLCRKGSSYDANDTKLMYSWIKNERWHKHKLIVVEMELHCRVSHELPRYAETPRGKAAPPQRGERLLHDRTQKTEGHPCARKVCGVWGDLLEGGPASRCCTQPQCLMEPPPFPSSSLPSIFFIHLERVCGKWKRGRYKSSSGCTGIVFQIHCNRNYVLDPWAFY